jgi:arylformamidase
MAEWIDVTVPIRSGMVHWPDNPPVHLESAEHVHESGICRVSRLSLGVHTGTHFDAPNHFGVPGGGVDALPIDAFVGEARVLEISSPRVDRGDLADREIARGERLLFKTNNSRRCWATDEFVPDYVYVTEEAATYLATRGVRTVGVDYLSLGGPDDGAAAHRRLLEAGVCILEGLDLRHVREGLYELIALPLLIPDSDGAPARVLLRRCE